MTFLVFKLTKTKLVKCLLSLKKNGKRDDELKGRCSKTVLQNLFGSHYRCLQRLAKPYALKAAKILHVFCSLKKIYGVVFSCSVYGD